MIIALHIRSDGTQELFEYDPRNGGLEELQARVGGWIEAAPVFNSRLSMYCNEEGKIDGLPLNLRASMLLDPNARDVIAGDVVVVGAPDADGYNTSLPKRLVELVSS